MTDEEKLSGFLDRELDQAAHADIEARAARDADTAALLERLRGNDDLVRAAFDAPMHEGVPERFATAIDAGLASQTHARVDLAAHPRPGNDNQRWWHLGGAVAASLAVGLVLGTQMLAPAGDATTSVALSDALNTTPSLQTVTLASGERLTPILTFGQAGGGYCRQFRMAVADRDRAGVACRNRGQWAVEAIMPSTAVNSAEDNYVTAEGAAPSSVEGVIDTLRAGDPLDSGAENALIARAWQ